MYVLYKVITSARRHGVIIPLTKAFCGISRSLSHTLCHGLGWNLAQFIIIKVSALQINSDPFIWSQLFGISCCRSEHSIIKHVLQSSGERRGWGDFTGWVIYYWDIFQVSIVHPGEEQREHWGLSGRIEGQESFPSIIIFLSWLGLSPLGKPSIFQILNKEFRNAFLEL